MAVPSLQEKKIKCLVFLFPEGKFQTECIMSEYALRWCTVFIAYLEAWIYKKVCAIYLKEFY